MSPRLYISSRTVLSSLTVLLFLSAWVGIRGLNADSFWLDEIWTVRQAHLATPLDVWSQISAHDPWQAPGYFMAVQVWGGLAGWSELAIRFLSLLAGLLGIAFTYRLAREFTNRQGALAAAVLLGASAYFLYFFHEARAYTLYVLLTPMMVWAYRRFAISARGGGVRLLIGLCDGGRAICSLFRGTHGRTSGSLPLLGGLALVGSDAAMVAADGCFRRLLPVVYPLAERIGEWDRSGWA